MKKCIYCRCDLDDYTIVDFCERCGKGAFGERMFRAIVQNMQEAKKRGDLEQSWISNLFKPIISNPFRISSKNLVGKSNCLKWPKSTKKR